MRRLRGADWSVLLMVSFNPEHIGPNYEFNQQFDAQDFEDALENQFYDDGADKLRQEYHTLVKKAARYDMLMFAQPADAQQLLDRWLRESGI